MTRAAHNHQFAIRPGFGEFPCCHEWTRKIETALYHEAGDAGESICFPQQDAVFEPGVVSEVVRYDARTRHPKFRL